MKVPSWDSLWIGPVATLAPGEDDPWGAIETGALAVADGRIEWLGAEDELPGPPEKVADRVHRTGGAWVTPGLVDCHTHLVFGGHRAREFERRLAGASYEEIAREGGGILSTVRATREAPEGELFRAAQSRMEALMAGGVTTVEIKSGYGLEVEAELRMLRVARKLGRELPVDVRTTLLGAHALPPEYGGDRAGYLTLVREEMIPRAAEEGLADAVDAFCEGIAFGVEECRKVLEAGMERGLDGRLHADQLSDLGGAALAAEVGARSADHLEHASPEGIRAMARAGTVAVLLPGAFYFLGQDRAPDVAALREEGVAMALATDLNPGSSPVLSPLLALSMGCALFGLTPAEALAGMTVHGARVLGLEEDRGTLDVGKRADLAVWGVGHPSELAYWIGGSPLRALVKDGAVLEL